MYPNPSIQKISNSNKIWSIVDLVRLFKFRLSLTVAISSAISYLIAIENSVSVGNVVLLFIGGLLTTFGASGLNQILEKDFDFMMKRTSNRPVASGIMSESEALFFSILCGLIGVLFLAKFNALTAFLSMASLILYAFVYTPIKRVTPWAVVVGAIPGALPVVIGCTAAQGTLSSLWVLTLFLFQFLWQLPHFWAIAWLGDSDYRNAGFKLLPTADNSLSYKVGLFSACISVCLLPIVWIPYFFGAAGIVSALFLSILTFILIFMSWQLKTNCNRKYALRLMLFSIIYLPISLILFLIDKI